MKIHEDNQALLELPSNHPAVRALYAHAECRELCVGREIDWPDSDNVPIEQEWYSQIDKRKWSFSGFAYAFISFDLVLGGWICMYGDMHPFEKDFLHELPRLRGLLKECESAAKLSDNQAVIPLIDKVREFFDAYQASIVDRVVTTNLGSWKLTEDSLWATGSIRDPYRR